MTHHLTLVVHDDPCAHRWHGQTVTWGGDAPRSGSETLTFGAGEGAETVPVLACELPQACGESLSVWGAHDPLTGAVVVVGRRGTGNLCEVLVVEPAGAPAGVATRAAASRWLRDLLEPTAAAVPVARPVPATHAIVRRVFGTDRDVAKAARVSYAGDKVPRTAAQDRKLLRYLMEHRHTSPFEQCALVFEVRAPLYVVAQLARHRTFKANEQSLRYTEAGDGNGDDFDTIEIFAPEDWRGQGSGNKQVGSGDLNDATRFFATEIAKRAAAVARDAYQDLLDRGVAREQARAVLPTATYKRMVVQCDLHNMLHFLGLRLAPGAQYEMRVLAAQMAEAVSRHFPWTWRAWLDLAAPQAVREMAAGYRAEAMKANVDVVEVTP